MKSNEALLLVNLGSPKNLDKKSVKEYLHVFLSDDYVVDIPKFIQQLILRLFILPFRPKQTLHAYEQIWTCLLYTSPSPRDPTSSRMPSSA